MDDRLRPDEARRRIRRILAGGGISYSSHALAEMIRDDLSGRNCEDALRAGIVEEPEWENGSWRYRVRTSRARVVVAFRGRERAVVVTAWRLVR